VLCPHFAEILDKESRVKPVPLAFRAAAAAASVLKREPGANRLKIEERQMLANYLATG
jgi:hypothetical protein